MEVKHIEPGNPGKTLEGISGKVYKEIELTAGRFPKWQQAWARAMFNMNPLEMFRQNMHIKTCLSKNDVYNASVAVEKFLNGSAALADEQAHHWMEIIALFYVSDDEDIATISDELIKSKALDLGQYSQKDLFCLAVTLIPDWLAAYEESRKAIYGILEPMINGTNEKTKSAKKKG